MKKTMALFAALTMLVTVMLPMSFGMSASATTITEETTTTPTTAVACYATQVSYDNSEMQIGETRAVRVYHPETGTAAGMTVYEVSDNISVSYDADGDTLYVTAVAAGNAKLYVHEKNCAFGAYVYFTVGEEQAPPTDNCGPMLGDVDEDGLLTTADARLVLQYTLRSAVVISAQANYAEYLLDYNDDGEITTADARDILIATL